MLEMDVHQQKTDRPLFRGDRVERKFRVLVDIDTVSGDPKGTGPTDLVTALLLDKQVESYKWSDNGAPASAPRMTTDWWPPAPIGWLVASEARPGGIASHTLTYSDGDRLSQTAVVGGLTSAVGEMIAAPGGAALEDKRDALLALSAAEIGSDLLITERASLISKRPLSIHAPLTIVTPAEALSIIGLYLRSTGTYVPTRSDHSTILYNRGLFWSAAAEGLAPSIARVVELSVSHDQVAGHEQLAPLALAMRRRLARCLERRDSIWRLIDQAQDRDISEDALASMESLLMFLMGAMDASARLASQLLGLKPVSPTSIAWQRRDWRKLLRVESSALFDMTSGGSVGGRSLLVLAGLRNLIHAEGLDSVSVQVNYRSKSTWVVFGAEDGEQLAEHIRAIGGKEAWGLHEWADGRTLAELGKITDGLVAQMFALADAISAEIALVLTGNGVPNLDSPKSELNEALIAEHLLWQIGLPDPLARVGK